MDGSQVSISLWGGGDFRLICNVGPSCSTKSSSIQVETKDTEKESQVMFTSSIYDIFFGGALN
jgi:hypothetical protein